MGSSIVNVVDIFGVFAFVIILLFLIGQATLWIANIRVKPDTILPLSIGLGLVLVSFTGAMSNTTKLPIPQSLFGLGAVLFVCVLARGLFIILVDNDKSKKKGKITTQHADGSTQRLRGLVSSAWLKEALASLLASSIFMYPATQHGLTSWTLETNDYPSYVGSTLIWLNGEEAFRAQHDGAFERGIISRASYEKPMVTAFLSFLVIITRLQPQELLPVLMWVPLFLLLLSLLALNRKIFSRSPNHQILIILAVAGSNVPMARVFDAQPGQVLMVGLLVFTILLFFETLETSHSELKKYLIGVFFVALSISVTLGANPTVLVGVGPLVAAFILWLAMRSTPKKTITQVVTKAGATIVMSALLSFFLLPSYLKSFLRQSNGEPGFNIPVNSPLALFGLEANPYGSIDSIHTLRLWLVVILALLTIFIFSKERRRLVPEFILLATFFTNFGTILALYGLDSYNGHKYFSAALAMVLPIMIAQFFERALRIIDLKRATAITLISVSSFGTLSMKVDFLHPKVWDTISNLTSPSGNINVLTPEIWKSSLIALAVNGDTSVRLLSRSYWHRSQMPYKQSPVLTTKKGLSKLEYSELNEISPGLFLVSPVFPFKEDMKFTNNQEESIYNLFGSWSEPEEWGTWSNGKQNFIFIDFPENLGPEACTIILNVGTYQPEGRPNSLTVVINEGIKRAYFSSSQMKEGEVRIFLTSKDLEGIGSLLSIQLIPGNLYSPSSFGSADLRNLGVFLKGLSVRLIGTSLDD